MVALEEEDVVALELGVELVLDAALELGAEDVLELDELEELEVGDELVELPL